MTKEEALKLKEGTLVFLEKDYTFYGTKLFSGFYFVHKHWNSDSIVYTLDSSTNCYVALAFLNKESTKLAVDRKILRLTTNTEKILYGQGDINE